MSTTKSRMTAPLAAALLAGCASFPSGPSMLALPGTGATFEQFRADDFECRDYASQAAGGQSPRQAASTSGVDTAVVGTAVGAATGAMLGAASGHPGQGAAIGAGSGFLIGSAAGAESFAVAGSKQQQRYDNAYIQCMYAKGHQVPVPAGVAAQQAAPANPPPPVASPPGAAAYPPPGTPPPPGY